MHSPNEDPSLYRFLNKKLKEKGETENPPVIENLKPKTAGSEKASCIDRGSVVDWNLLTSIDQAILQFRDHQGTLYDILLKLCKEACLKFGRPSNIQKTFLKAHDRDEDTLRDVIRFCLEDLEGWESDVASRVACYLGWNRYWKLGDQPRRRSSGFTSPSGPARPGPRDTAPADARSPEAIRGLAAALRRKNKNLSEEESIAIAKQELGVA